jgi:hypothetical protein
MAGMPKAADRCFQVAFRIDQEVGGDDHLLAAFTPSSTSTWFSLRAPSLTSRGSKRPSPAQ